MILTPCCIFNHCGFFIIFSELRMALCGYKFNEQAVCLRDLEVAGWITDYCHPYTNLGVGISEGCFTLRFITFGGHSAHLAYHVYKSCRKTSIIIIILSFLDYHLVKNYITNK